MINFHPNNSITNTDIMKTSLRYCKKVSFNLYHLTVSIPVNKTGLRSNDNFNQQSKRERVTISFKYQELTKTVVIHITGESWSTDTFTPSNALTIYRQLMDIRKDITHKTFSTPLVLHTQSVMRVAKIAWLYYKECRTKIKKVEKAKLLKAELLARIEAIEA